MERNINLVCARRSYRRLTTAREKVAYLAAECGNQFADSAAVTDTPRIHCAAVDIYPTNIAPIW